MRKTLFVIILLFSLLGVGSVTADSLEDYTYVPLRRKLRYAEEFYGLYRENMHRGTENLNANVFWLLYALKYPFSPPVQALAKIETPDQWKKYKNLFYFQIYYLITDTYLRLGEKYEKNNIFFFNYAFKKEIQEGLQISRIYYERSRHYWHKADEMARTCWEERDIPLQSVTGETNKWEDRVYRYISGNQEMNYPKEIRKRIEEVDRKLQMLEKGEYKK